MGLRLHHWIRDTYLAAAEHGNAGLAAALLARVALLVAHTASQWRVIDTHGDVVSHCVHEVSGRSRPGGGQDMAPANGERDASFAVSGHADNQLHRFTFRRDDAVRGFDAEERATMEAMVEHLVGAYSLARHLAEFKSSGERDRVGIARIDPRGHVTAADAEFTRLLRGALPDWDGRMLPFKLPTEIDPARPGIVFQGLWVAIQPRPGGHELRVRPDRRAVKLSDREMEIAERVAEGYTFREIGAKIGVAPSTVSTHLYNLYAKLGIRRRAELVGWLRHRRSR